MRLFRFSAAIILLSALSAQTRPVDRIARAVDDHVTVMRPGNIHPLASAETDAGIAAPEHRMDRMVLVLEPGDSQKQALAALLEAQQDPRSPEYHQWLTPEAFGERFGASEHDLAQMVNWLAGHGFEVEPIPSGRSSIVFSGTAAQVQQAFHAQIHVYDVAGKRHYANARNPEIPAALADVVAGIASLHDFRSEPLHHILKPLAAPSPEYSNGATHYIAPADFAAIYDVAALYNNSLDGTGQSIAVVARSNFNPADVASFRSAFGLPALSPTVVLNGPDPGIVSSDEQTEAQLDVEWAGAIAKNANVQFVLSGSTGSSDGVLLSSQYIVNHNLAPVMSLSFGLCEAAMGASLNQAWNSLWQQAAAEGITVLVASGDSGAAGCDSPSLTKAVSGSSVNGLCSSPYSTCVGGTQLNDASSPSLYWSATTNPKTYGSALGYVPEVVWNASAGAGGSGLWATGGGASSVYGKPAWQAGPGVPSDGHRDVPDVSLTASIHDGYLFYLNGQIYLVGGTSASTPALAGILALAVQRAGAAQGCINPTLYTLATNQSNGGAAVFHDVTGGNNSVPGAAGYNAGVGYDLATGLGSVDALLLVNHWSDAAIPQTPALHLAASSASVTLSKGASAAVPVNVSVSGGFNAAVSLSPGALPAGVTASLSPPAFSAPGAGLSTLTLKAASSAASGSFTLNLVANGGGTSQTLPLSVTIQQACSYSINPTSAAAGASGGSFAVAVTATSGCSWTATSAANWITVAAGASGAGNGNILYSVASNSTAAVRAGSLAIAGYTVTVTQAAGASSASVLSPSSAIFLAPGARASLSIASPGNSSWTAASTANWIRIISGATSARGNKTVNYLVNANNSASSRSASITVAGQTFAITQAGTSCGYGVNLGNMTPTTGGFNGNISVSTTAACPWPAVSNTSWITVPVVGGTGPGAFSFFVNNNPNSAVRTGTLNVAGYTIQVSEGPKGNIVINGPIR